MSENVESPGGILLIDKPAGKTSFSLVAALRRILSIKRIGHAGTLDPFATGVMVLLIGRSFTKLSDSLLASDKEYLAHITLGRATDSYDIDGVVTHQFEGDSTPSLQDVAAVINRYQGEIKQVPPMFSAKKINGQKLYHLARKGKTVERAAVNVNVKTELIDFQYPNLHLRIECSKGTYIRSIANSIGQELGTYGFLQALKRTRSGYFNLSQCMDGALLFEGRSTKQDIEPRLLISHVFS